MSRHRRNALAASALAACLAACASEEPRAAAAASGVISVGDHFDTPSGEVFVIRVQDEYRVIRCISKGPIQGCFDDLAGVESDRLEFNRWMPVQKVPGLEFAVLSPREVAFRMRASGTSR